MGIADIFQRFQRTDKGLMLPEKAEPTVVVVEAQPQAVASTIPQGVSTAAGWAWRILLIAALVIGLVWTLQHFSQVTVPLAIAVMLAALLAPLVERLRGWGWPPLLASAAALLGMALLIVAIMFGIGVTAARQTPQLVDQSIAGFQQLLTWLSGDPWHIDQEQIDGWMKSVTDWVNNSRATIAAYAGRIGAQVGHFFAGVAIALIATFFFLADGGRIWAATLGFLPAAYREPTRAAGARGWSSLVSYMRAQVLVSAVDAAGVTLVAALLGVPMWFALFALTFVVCFIPVVGAIIAGTVATLLALVTHGLPAALIMLGGTIAVMWLESHLLQPLLLGKAASLHPLAVLVGLVIGSELAGIVGALIVIPVLSFGVAFVRSLRGVPVEPAQERKH